MGIEMIIALGIGGFGYFKTRRFVRERLRFIDAVQKPVAPVVAGLGTAVATGVLVAVIPFVGGLTIPVLAGLGIGVGLSHGAKDSKRLPAP
jgi:hypothetical protein